MVRKARRSEQVQRAGERGARARQMEALAVGAAQLPQEMAGNQCGLDAWGTGRSSEQRSRGRSRRRAAQGVQAVQSSAQAPALCDLDPTGHRRRRHRDTGGNNQKAFLRALALLSKAP